MIAIQGWKLPLRHVNIGFKRKKERKKKRNRTLSIWVSPSPTMSIALNFGYCILSNKKYSPHLMLTKTIKRALKKITSDVFLVTEINFLLITSLLLLRLRLYFLSPGKAESRMLQNTHLNINFIHSSFNSLDGKFYIYCLSFYFLIFLFLIIVWFCDPPWVHFIFSLDCPTLATMKISQWWDD